MHPASPEAGAIRHHHPYGRAPAVSKAVNVQVPAAGAWTTAEHDIAPSSEVIWELNMLFRASMAALVDMVAVGS